MTTNFTEKLDEVLDNTASAIFHMNRGDEVDGLIAEVRAGLDALRKLMQSTPQTDEESLQLADQMDDALHAGLINELNESIAGFNAALARYATARGARVMSAAEFEAAKGSPQILDGIQ